MRVPCRADFFQLSLRGALLDSVQKKTTSVVLKAPRARRNPWLTIGSGIWRYGELAEPYTTEFTPGFASEAINW